MLKIIYLVVSRGSSSFSSFSKEKEQKKKNLPKNCNSINIFLLTFSSLKCAKRGGGTKKKCVFLPYEKLLFYQAYAKNVRVPSKPPAPTLNLGKESPP